MSGRPVRTPLVAITVLAAATLTLAAVQMMGGPDGSVGQPGSQSPSASSPAAQPSLTPVAISSCPVMPTAAASPSEIGNLDATGILLVAIGEQVQAGPACEMLAEAFSRALQLAMDHPDDFGYPWLDPATNELVFSVVTSEGRSLVDAAGTTVTVPYRIRAVAHSYGELQQIQDDVTYLRSEGVVDAELIYEVLPDDRDNRTLIVMSDLSRPLLEELASRFPPGAIAVQVDPNQAPTGY